MSQTLRSTRSVCPICLKNIPAELINERTAVLLKKTCPDHGTFSAPIWRNRIDFNEWCSGTKEMEVNSGHQCPSHCGICSDHEQGTCCVLLEVTNNCNLRCRYCFAQGGDGSSDPDAETIRSQIKEIIRLTGNPLIQFSGGEPTLRDDLPELIAFAIETGCSYTQLNSNGIRLSQDKEYVKRLAEAGLSFVFLQFDALSDDVYQKLRGESLFQTKLRAIENCDAYGIGVTLVPTIVRGINNQILGEIVRFAAGMSPAVRGVHFQPVSFIGRYGDAPNPSDRYTLDELLYDLCKQTQLSTDAFSPSRCDHPLCGFHATFLAEGSGILRPISKYKGTNNTKASSETNRNYVARHWSRQTTTIATMQPTSNHGVLDGIPDMQTFLETLRNNSLTISSMVFQDAWNLNIERLRRCSLHVYRNGKIAPFCANYLTEVAP